MLQNIPFQRLLIYAMVLCLIPFLFVVFQFYSKLNSVADLETQLEKVQHLALVQEKRQANNLTVISHFKDADHFYIDKNLETLTFLEPEVEALQKIVSHKNFPDDEVIKKRLEFLTGSGNSLKFSEGVVQTFPQFQETTETMIHSVEINIEDLQKILTRVEGVAVGPFEPSPNRPQLIVLEFKLDKKKAADKNEVFLLNMKLLKREFL
ncbi:hypothetical protein PHSC3_000815 [Chlamydiales bacterium STE3]|nr:hypothetical protein PHSC3_000815 [Chlamydiales bacterium STE3]